MDDIRARFGAVIYWNHALEQIVKRGIDPASIREAVLGHDSEVIEARPDDPRGSCCLVLGWWDDRRPLHILFGLNNPFRILSAYDPSIDPLNRWEADFRTRRRARPGGRDA